MNLFAVISGAILVAFFIWGCLASSLSRSFLLVAAGLVLAVATLALGGYLTGAY